MALYRFAAPVTLEEADAIRLEEMVLDLRLNEVRITYSVLDQDDNVVEPRTATLPMATFDAFVNNAGMFPGSTFAAKIHSQNAIQAIVPSAPSGGSVETE